MQAPDTQTVAVDVYPRSAPEVVVLHRCFPHVNSAESVAGAAVEQLQPVIVEYLRDLLFILPVKLHRQPRYGLPYLADAG